MIRRSRNCGTHAFNARTPAQSERLPRLFFTEAGLVELRAMMAADASPIRNDFPICAKSSASTPCQRRTRRKSDGASTSARAAGNP